jgi:hypothetical protein
VVLGSSHTGVFTNRVQSLSSAQPLQVWSVSQRAASGVKQWAFIVQATQLLLSVSQWGVSPLHSSLSVAVHCTHRLSAAAGAVLQTGVEAVSVQPTCGGPLSTTHATQALLTGSQASFPQWSCPRHSTHTLLSAFCAFVRQ